MSTPPLLQQSPTPPTRGRRTAWSLRPGLLAVAVGCAFAVWALQQFFTQTGEGYWRDDGWRTDIQSAAGPAWELRAHDFGVFSLRLGLLLCVVLAVVTLARRRVDLFVRGAVLVAGANATTQILKHVVIERPPELAWGYSGFNSLPSGHVTLVASVAFAAWIVAPATWRPLVTLVGGTWVAAISVATIVSGWHRPSDTIAALAVCVGWACIVSAVQFRRRPSAHVPQAEGSDSRFVGR